MKRSLAATILASIVWLHEPAAHAQAPAPDETLTRSRLNLTLEQRHVIKELIKDMRIAPSATSVHSIGDAVSGDAALRLMPDEVMRKVPHVRAHRFVYTRERILIVDPKDNRIDEIIEVD